MNAPRPTAFDLAVQAFEALEGESTRERLAAATAAYIAAKR